MRAHPPAALLARSPPVAPRPWRSRLRADRGPPAPRRGRWAPRCARSAGTGRWRTGCRGWRCVRCAGMAWHGTARAVLGLALSIGPRACVRSPASCSSPWRAGEAAGCWLGWANVQPLHPDHRSLHHQSRRLAVEQAVEAEHGTATPRSGKGGAGASGSRSRSLGRSRRRPLPPRRPAKNRRDRDGGRCWPWRWRYQYRRWWGRALWSCPRTSSLSCSCRAGCEWSGALRNNNFTIMLATARVRFLINSYWRPLCLEVRFRLRRCLRPAPADQLKL
jgi:hypothetical protein